MFDLCYTMLGDSSNICEEPSSNEAQMEVQFEYNITWLKYCSHHSLTRLTPKSFQSSGWTTMWKNASCRSSFASSVPLPYCFLNHIIDRHVSEGELAGIPEFTETRQPWQMVYDMTLFCQAPFGKCTYRRYYESVIKRRWAEWVQFPDFEYVLLN